MDTEIKITEETDNNIERQRVESGKKGQLKEKLTTKIRLATEWQQQ